jgi:hypothetical protein
MQRRDWIWLIIILGIFQMGQFFTTTWLRQTGPAGTALRGSPNVQYLILPNCPTDTSSLEAGAICWDSATGVNKQRDASGVKDL